MKAQFVVVDFLPALPFPRVKAPSIISTMTNTTESITPGTGTKEHDKATAPRILKMAVSTEVGRVVRKNAITGYENE